MSGPRAASKLLDDALHRAAFWDVLEARRKEVDLGAEALRIVVKPDLGAFARGSPLCTDPQLVEAFIDSLHDRGFSNVAVAHCADTTDLWLANRDALALVDLLGYRFVTAKGRPYEVCDLSEHLVDAGFPPETVLCGTSLASAWVDAHFRVSFAKNKTHEDAGFSLSLSNLMTVLPLRDKHREYRVRRDPGDVCVGLLRCVPVHFALIDAVVSNHGSFGGSVARPIDTSTIIAGTDPVLTDWIGAAKMGVDPCVSPLLSAALDQIHLPEPHVIDGDLSPYAEWMNVPPEVLESTRRIQATLSTARLLSPCIPNVSRELFPFHDRRADSLNAWLSRLYAQADDSAAALAAVTALQAELALLVQAWDGWRTLADKTRLRRRETSLDLDPTSFGAEDYAAVVGYLAPLERLVRAAKADGDGLKHRYVGGSFVLEASRVLDVPYARFIERVPIENAVQLMNDYIGGRAVIASRDAEGRVANQAERTVFLPQPNFAALYGGKPIDVVKLEAITRTSTQEKIHWRTVGSPNSSAYFDDGAVTFEEVAGDATRVTILVRQRFDIPALWRAAGLDKAHAFKKAVELWAYRRYVEGTMRNFEACYEGRDARVGRAWDGRDDDPWERGTDALRRLGERLPTRHLAGALEAVRRGPHAYATDEQGFEHFEAANAAPRRLVTKSVASARNVVKSLFRVTSAFASELSEVVRRDVDVWLPQGSGSTERS